MLSVVVYTLGHTFGVFRAPPREPAPQRWLQGREDGTGVWLREGGEHGAYNQREKHSSVTVTTTHQHYIVRHTRITKCTRSVKIHSGIKLNDLYNIFKIKKTERGSEVKNHSNNLNNTQNRQYDHKNSIGEMNWQSEC